MSNVEFTTPELPSIGFAADLADDDRLLLGSYGDFLSFQPDQQVIVEGRRQEHLYLVISGVLHASRQVEGRDSLLGRIGAGESMGEINIFDPAEASATVVAREYVQIWRINRESLEGFMAVYPIAAGNVLVGIAVQLSRRLRSATERIVKIQEMQAQSNLMS